MELKLVDPSTSEPDKVIGARGLLFTKGGGNRGYFRTMLTTGKPIFRLHVDADGRIEWWVRVRGTPYQEYLPVSVFSFPKNTEINDVRDGIPTR